MSRVLRTIFGESQFLSGPEIVGKIVISIYRITHDGGGGGEIYNVYIVSLISEEERTYIVPANYIYFVIY